MKNKSYHLYAIYASIALGTCLILFQNYYHWYFVVQANIKDGYTILAQFGDFVGGTLNPILTFITIALLIWSIRIQMSELKATR